MSYEVRTGTIGRLWNKYVPTQGMGKVAAFISGLSSQKPVQIIVKGGVGLFSSTSGQNTFVPSSLPVSASLCRAGVSRLSVPQETSPENVKRLIDAAVNNQRFPDVVAGSLLKYGTVHDVKIGKNRSQLLFVNGADIVCRAFDRIGIDRYFQTREAVVREIVENKFGELAKGTENWDEIAIRMNRLSQRKISFFGMMGWLPAEYSRGAIVPKNGYKPISLENVSGLTVLNFPFREYEDMIMSRTGFVAPELRGPYMVIFGALFSIGK